LSYGQSFFQSAQVRKNKFKIYCFNITGRVNTAADMNNIVIFKAAHNMNNCIDLTDVGKEFIPSPLPLKPFDKTRYVNKSITADVVLMGLYISVSLSSWNQNGYNADIRLNSTKSIVCGAEPTAFVIALNNVLLPTLGKPTIT
jgi:hypothetical protein